ncbi:MAG: family N-acetyltransferase [Sphingomonadales bacterium]|jgi:ribosomal protein S18 acetylase RimI-like enzyme|nr:family N-acetyltransferase [Sphingomonadales bacterium]
MAATLRIAVPDDIPALHRLIESAYRGDSARRGWTHEADLLDGQRTDLEALGALMRDPGQRMIIAEADSAPVGCVQVADNGNRVAYLGHLSVDPDLQGGGLGRMLVSAAESEAISTFGAQMMEMTVISQRTELVGWYERLGYAVTGEHRPFPLDDIRFGIPRTRNISFIVMAKSL